MIGRVARIVGVVVMISFVILFTIRSAAFV
jgi:hypothetical protein